MIYAIFWLITRTARLRIVGEESLGRLRDAGKAFILASWHGKTLLPMYHLRGRNYWTIISLSRDGDIQNLMVTRNGFCTIRGSTGRQGARALVESARKLVEGRVLSITPDGPKGPPRQVQAGIVHMAHRSRCPVIPVGVAASPRWVAASWDSYMVPLPFARSVIHFGEPVAVGAPDDYEDAEAWLRAETSRIAQAIDDADAHAAEQLQAMLDGRLVET